MSSADPSHPSDPAGPSGPLADLRRWEDAGATWRVLAHHGEVVTVALCRCDGGEEVDRLVSADPALVAYVAGPGEVP